MRRLARNSSAPKKSWETTKTKKLSKTKRPRDETYCPEPEKKQSKLFVFADRIFAEDVPSQQSDTTATQLKVDDSSLKDSTQDNAQTKAGVDDEADSDWGVYN